MTQQCTTTRQSDDRTPFERSSLIPEVHGGLDITAVSIAISGITCWISVPLAYFAGWL